MSPGRALHKPDRSVKGYFSFVITHQTSPKLAIWKFAAPRSNFSLKKREEKKSQSPSLPIHRSHSYLQATSAWPRSLIKAKGCPDLSPFPLKCSVLCSGRKSLAAWFNEPSVEPADLMTCENINLLPPRALLLRKQSIIHSGLQWNPIPQHCLRTKNPPTKTAAKAEAHKVQF